jgi:hypothetical protein
LEKGFYDLPHCLQRRGFGLGSVDANCLPWLKQWHNLGEEEVATVKVVEMLSGLDQRPIGNC